MSNVDGRTTAQLRNLSKQRTAEVLRQPGSLERFAGGPLSQIKGYGNVGKTASFLPSNLGPSPYAAALQPQRLAGMSYANYENKGPAVGGQLRAPMPRPGMVPPGTQPTVVPNPNAPTTPTEDAATSDDILLASVNKTRIEDGQEPFETIEEFTNNLLGDIGHIGMAADGGYVLNGGISSLQPEGMFLGGFLGGSSNTNASASPAAPEGAGGIAGLNATPSTPTPVGGVPTDNTDADSPKAQGGSGSEKSIDQMSRQELIALIRSKGAGTEDTSNDEFTPLVMTPVARAQGGLMALADGGDVYYPRMNGQIAGPGTERSDDIPAMLSDGEFVVNAKALRGIGKMDGANGDKEDQRMKGARMMYAMQQAGEQAMRKG